MAKARALLLGVPKYTSAAIRALPFVRNDVRLLHSVLEQSGYDTRSIDLNDMINTSRSSLRAEILRECNRSGEILILYFSGHGLHYAGKDYLVPADFSADEPTRVQDYLVPVDLVHESTAGPALVVFLIDACREGVSLEAKSLGIAAWGRGEIRAATNRDVVIVQSCRAGELSRFTPGEQGLSLFTTALADVLNPDHPARTLTEVVEATKERLDQLSALHEMPRQTVTIRAEMRPGHPSVGDRVIGLGKKKSESRQTNKSGWVEALERSGLWTALQGDSPDLKWLRFATSTIVELCASHAANAKDVMGDDPWIDDDLAVRTLGCIEMLVLREPPIELTPPEIGLLAVTPFMRELVLRQAAARFTNENPYDFEITETATPTRIDLEKVLQALPALTRKAARFKEHERIAEMRAVAWWLIHQAVARQPRTWKRLPQGTIPDTIETLVSTATACADLAARTFTVDRLIELARSTGSDPEHIARDDSSEHLMGETTAGGYAPNRRVREKLLAYLVSLAGYLAIDIRTLSSVIVDHIGLADPLQPRTALETLSTTIWMPIGHTRDLSAQCPHPALDLALREHTDHSDRILKRVVRAAAREPSTRPLVDVLPSRLTHDQVRPVAINDHAAYELPHLRFELAQDEIRELLMGVQLYGDPTLAIRELYQNAVDACRYREARETFLLRTRAFQSGWKPAVVFRQHDDDSGRPYIECQDNGIGMGMREVSDSFSRAGKRFHDLPEFIEEQIDWLALSPPIKLYPMSQFGIGVLSYFMLADEIHIETSRLSRDGQPGKLLTIQISGSGSLFRIQESDHRGLATTRDSGTRVRLYLNKTTYDSHYSQRKISCFETLNDVVAIPAMPLSIDEYSRKSHWSASELVAMEETTVPTSDPGFWWEFGWFGGEVLSDGIRTKSNRTATHIVNLAEAHRPRLSVNRQSRISLDDDHIRARGYAVAAVAANAAKHVTLRWLTKLAREIPEAADRVAELFITERRKILLGQWSHLRFAHNVEIDLADIGWMAGDDEIIEALLVDSDKRHDVTLERTPPWLLAERVALWQLLLSEFEPELDMSEVVARSVGSDLRASRSPSVRVHWTSLTARDQKLLVRANGKWHLSFDVIDITRAAQRSNLELWPTYIRLCAFRDYGLNVTNLDERRVTDLSERDTELLARLRSTDVNVQDLVMLTLEGESLAVTFDAVSSLAGVGIQLSMNRAHLGNEIASPALRRLVPMIGGRVLSWMAVTRVSSELKLPIIEILEAAKVLADCGIAIPTLTDAKIGSRIITEAEVGLMSLMERDELPSRFMGLVQHAVNHSLTLYTVFAQMNDLSYFGVPLWHIQMKNDITPNKDDLLVLSRDLDLQAPWLIEHEPSVSHYEKAALLTGTPWAQLRERVGHLMQHYHAFSAKAHL